MDDNNQPSAARRRETILPLDQEMERLDELREDFLQTIQEELAEFGTSDLKEAYVKARSQFGAYSKRAKGLRTRLVEKGRVSEGESCRTDAVKDAESLRDFKKSVNEILRSQDCSEFPSSL